MWILVAEIAGASVTTIVLGAYALAYAVLRLEQRIAPEDRCPSIYCLASKKRYGEYRCVFESGHQGPHHAIEKNRNRRELWWFDQNVDKLLWTKQESESQATADR